MWREFDGQSDQALLARCDMHIYKASGPGGQHRNKVSSAIRLRHQPTGISATANDSRSQHRNKTLAIVRLRMNLAIKLRCPKNPDDEPTLPEVLTECLSKGPPKKSTSTAKRKVTVGRKDHRFWHVAAILLDLLDGAGGRLSAVATYLELSTGNLTSLLKSDRHLFAETQSIRKQHQQPPLS